MAARAAISHQDLVGHTSQMMGPVVGTGKGEVREVIGVLGSGVRCCKKNRRGFGQGLDVNRKFRTLLF